MKKLLAAVILGLLVLLACQSDGESCKKKNNEASVMYKETELALLMRDMYDQGEVWKEAIETDSFNVDFPSDYYGIFTVEATDSAVRNQTFMSMGDVYLKSVKDLVETKKQKKQLKKFNTMVDACINCHQVFCQGPIDKISKLYIQE